MNKRALRDYLIAIATFVLGAAVARKLSTEAGIAIVAAGGALVGRLMKQPDYAHKAQTLFPKGES